MEQETILLNKPKVELRIAQKLFLEKQKIKVGSITLRTAQVNLNNKLDKLIAESKKETFKGIFIFPTGLGKSFGSFSHALRFVKDYEKRTGKKGKILVLVHTEPIMKQHKKDFKKLCNKSIGFMYKSKKEPDSDIIIGCVRTMKNYLNKFKPDRFVYIIVDETQHATAKTWKINLDYFKPLVLLGMTATPNRTDEKDILPIYDNNKILEYTEEYCFKKKWLRPYNLLTLWDPHCDYGDINGYYDSKKHIFMYNMRKVGKKYLVPERIEGIIRDFKNGIDIPLKRPNGEEFYFKGIEDRQGIYFLPRIEAVKKYCEEFNKAGIKSAYILGKTSPKKRDKIFKDFADKKIQLIFNVNVITEGIHPKNVDVVIIDRPTDSHILWVQSKGRQLFNIEGQDYSREGMVIDLAGNSKNSFMKHITGSEGTHKGGKISELIENSIGVPCYFHPENINYFEKIQNDEKKTLQSAIDEYKRIYGDKKVARGLLRKDYHWIYWQFYKNGVMDNFLEKVRYFRKKWVYSIEKFKRICKKYKTVKMVSKKTGFCETTIWKMMKRSGLYHNPRTKFGDLIKDSKKIIRMYSNKRMSLKFIAKKLNCSSKLIRDVLINNNIQIIDAGTVRLKTNFYYPSKEEMIELLKNKTLNEIKEFLNCSIGYIYSIINRYGLNKKGHNIKQGRDTLGKFLPKRDNIKIIQNNKYITSISPYIPKIIPPPLQIKHKGTNKEYSGMSTNGYQDRTTQEKDEIRPKIVRNIIEGDNVIALESQELSFIKELRLQGINPKKVTIPNNREAVELVNALINYGYKIQSKKDGIVELIKENSFPIAVINTDAQTWLANTEEKYTFLWLDYCGAFSFYARDLDIVFAKHFGNMRLVLTYNLFDPIKNDENYYLTRVINYVLKKVSGKSKTELLEDITYRYKKNMYNIGFKIEDLIKTQVLHEKQRREPWKEMPIKELREEIEEGKKTRERQLKEMIGKEAMELIEKFNIPLTKEELKQNSSLETLEKAREDLQGKIDYIETLENKEEAKKIINEVVN